MTGRVAWVAASIALLLAAIAGMPSRCGAAGIGLRWGSCEGASNRNFACDPNTGSEVLVVSFSPATEIDALTGVAALGRIAAADGSVPPWWQMVNRGSCRYSSLSTSFVLDDQVECEDPW